MKLVKIDPPGSWCHYEAVMEMIHATGGKTFLEVGCGLGDLSLKLCQKEWRGVGIDFSGQAIEQAKTNLREYLESSRYRLVESDIFDLDTNGEKFDVGLSMMVMEHVENHVAFLSKISEFIRPDGHVIVAVPGRRDRWGVEDETVGHLRRYDRDDLQQTLLSAGLTQVEVWSVAVPVANLLFHMGNFLVRKSAEMNKLHQSAREQTETSGIREIPWKTVFPPALKLLLNRTTLYPLFVLQRLFYGSNLGLTMIAKGQVCDKTQ
ncbi:MAG: methyltransferase domain-containing protein [Deltaproteobacteria bacterium]|nr:methyltransferase domain-containing protein [Deltaproteobacteria bacterium]